jgi:CDP-glucose 4,6-dehydratase
MLHTLPAFYRGKRVLVTGHTGFQGGWLVSWLKLLGAQVCGYGLPPSTRPNFFDATILDRGITSIFADIRDRNALATAFAEFQPEIVIHCATQTNVESALEDPVQTFATNAMGTVHVLEEMRQTASVRALVTSSRVQAYKNRGWFWGDCQANQFSASQPVSSSFACSEFAAGAYLESFFPATKTAVAVARVPDLIGGGDWAMGRLIPELVRKITSHEPIVIKTGPASCWLHVLDAAGAYLRLGENLFEGHELSGAWNLGPSESNAMTSADLAKCLANEWGDGDVQFLLAEDSEPNSASRFETTAWRTKVGWSPMLGIEESISWTAAWYRSYYRDPNSACRVTEEQIGRYMRMQ